MAHTRCRSCAAPIFWVGTKHGKSMPLDVKAVPNGNIELEDEIAVVVRPDGSKRFVSHFTTCPNATNHRKDQ